MRCAENVENFAAFGRTFDNDRCLLAVSSDFVSIMRCACNIGEADADFETEFLCAKKARKALRVIPRGKHRLTVYRAHQVTRKAFLP